MRHPAILLGFLVAGCQAGTGDVPDRISAAEAPRLAISSVEPQLAASTGGETLTIRGAGFSPRPQVSIAGTPAVQVRWQSEGEISVRTPARLGVHGRVPIEIVNPDGRSAVRDDMFSYFAGVVQFRKSADYASGVAPIGVELLDLDRDGHLDMVTAFEARGFQTMGSAVSVLRGRGDGTFAFLADYPSGSGLHALGIGDLSGDGWQDLVMANARSNSVTVVLGGPGGSFGERREFPTGAYPVSLALADFNGDGRKDLVTANAVGVSLSLLLGQGDGGFAQRTLKLDAAPWAIAAGDVNDDGKADLLVTRFRLSEVAVLLGNGDGSFASPGAEYPTGAEPYALALGDVDGDRKPDLVVANRASNTVTVLIGRGDGSFAVKGSPYVGNSPIGVALGDVNGDRRLDVLVPCYDLKAVSVLMGNGDGRFRPAISYAVGGYPTAAALGDLNGDGLPDVVAGNGNVTYSVLVNSSM